MISPATNAVSRAPGNRHATVSCSLGRPADEDACLLHDRTTFDAINSVVEITPSAVVKRRAVTWHGMAAEAVCATENCRIECRFRAPLHLLALLEEGTSRDGFTFVEGLPRSALRNYRRKLIFVPAGHEYYDWQEPRSLARVAYFYFDPAALPVKPKLEWADMSVAPRPFFEDAGLWDTAIKLKALIESPQRNDRLYCEALGVVLAHELVRLNLDAARVEPAVLGGLAAWQQRAVAGLYRGAPRRANSARHPRPTRPLKSVPLLPSIQAIARHTAASISLLPSRRARQGIAGEARGLSDRCRNRDRVHRDKLFHRGVSKGDRAYSNWLSAERNVNSANLDQWIDYRAPEMMTQADPALCRVNRRRLRCNEFLPWQRSPSLSAAAPASHKSAPCPAWERHLRPAR